MYDYREEDEYDYRITIVEEEPRREGEEGV